MCRLQDPPGCLSFRQQPLVLLRLPFLRLPFLLYIVSEDRTLAERGSLLGSLTTQTK